MKWKSGSIIGPQCIYALAESTICPFQASIAVEHLLLSLCRQRMWSESKKKVRVKESKHNKDAGDEMAGSICQSRGTIMTVTWEAWAKANLTVR